MLKPEITLDSDEGGFHGARMPRPWFTGQQADLTISHGLEQIPKYGGWVIPDFQRGLVWTVEQKIRFIESIWMDLPIGVYVFNDDIGGKFNNWLLDGQQRWNAIYAYTQDEFEVFGSTYSGIHEYDKRRFNHRVFPARITRYQDESLLREIFERLAYGGTPNIRE